jgi:hypothetical protein
MWIRALVVAVLAFLIGYAVRDLIRANPQLFGRGRKPGPKRVGPDPGPLEPSGKVLSFRRRPHTILGVAEDASLDEARAAWERGKAENDPEKLAGMSDDLRSIAEVRSKELDQAWQAFQDERG